MFFGSFGWKPGTRLAVILRTDGASLSLEPVACETAEGSVVLDGKGRLGLPLALRQVTGATAGAFVFLIGTRLAARPPHTARPISTR